MSNPKCGVCAKTVYPMELVTAASKSFHKFCFKCEKCKTTLNLKNFKAHDGKIWCAVHYPPAQTKITTFNNDKSADSGTYENEAQQSATDAGGAWGGGQADAGEYANEPQAGYGGGGDAGGYDQGAGGYDQGGYDQGGYDQGGEGYDQGY
jgi:hypothetical protein